MAGTDEQAQCECYTLCSHHTMRGQSWQCPALAVVHLVHSHLAVGAFVCQECCPSWFDYGWRKSFPLITKWQGKSGVVYTVETPFKESEQCTRRIHELVVRELQENEPYQPPETVKALHLLCPFCALGRTRLGQVGLPRLSDHDEHAQ